MRDADPRRAIRALAVAIAWSLALPAAAAPAAAEAPPSKAARDPDAARKATTVAVIRLTGALPDGVGQGGLLADVSPHLHRLVERIDKAAADGRVKALVLVVESPDLGRGRVDELRAAIARVRAAGKTVAAHLVGGSPAQFMVAAACDTVMMPPAATLEVAGVHTEMMFFKTLLDRLGVAAEILQVGEFKGAGEPLTRDSMSPQLRAQYESFVGDLFEQLVERIAADRKLPAAKARDLVDTGVFTPEAARAAGLIDAVGYEDEVLAAAAAAAGIEQPKVVRDYAERKMDQDFSGIGGLVKLVELLSGQKQDKPAGAGRRIAVVHLTGEIREGKGRDDLLAGGAAGSEDLVKAIRQAAKDEKVAALVLRIDSPGGSALASDLIWREIERCGKPVVASLSDIAASGGYYVAVAADRIVAAPGTLTGSIGVVGGKVAVGGALEKVGVHTDVVSKGRNAGWLSMTEPFTPAGREAFMATMQDVYRLFTSKVAAGRKLEAAAVEKLAGGRVFTGRQALAAGLVDRLGTLDDAIDEARKLAGVAADEELDRVLLPEPRGLFDDLFGAAGRGTTPVARLAVGDGLRAALLARVAGVPALAALTVEIDALAEVLSGRPQLVLPARITIR
ncbi:MAG: signal peptide peptidase SppA [Planctomycetaceae bacterium]